MKCRPNATRSASPFATMSEAARGNDGALENLAQALCCDRRLTLRDDDIALRARHVEIGEAEAVQSICYISE